MRRRDVTFGLGALPLIAASAPASASAPDRLRHDFDRLLDRYRAAWKASDSAALARLYTPDVHWVNIVGMHWRGRADVEYAHRALFAGPLKGVAETLEEVESLTPLPGGGAVAVIRWSVAAYTSPSGRAISPGRTRMTLILVPRGRELAIAHGTNIQIVEAAQQSDPVRQRDAGKPD